MLMKSQSAGQALVSESAAGHGRDYAYLVAGREGDLQTLLKADVLAVHVDVDETSKLAGLVAEPLLEAGELRLQRLYAGGQRAAVAGDHVQVIGQLTQGRRYSYPYAHRKSINPPRYLPVPGPPGRPAPAPSGHRARSR